MGVVSISMSFWENVMSVNLVVAINRHLGSCALQDRTWCTYGMYHGSFKDHIPSTPGWL